METKQLKILILEDNETDAALIQRVLQRAEMDFEAIVVNDQNSFLTAIQNNVFDIILSDNYLPQFDATAAIQLIREHKVDTPLILVTGTVSEGFAVSMIKTGACDYILKDRLQRLPSAIVNAIERHTLKKKQKQDLDNLVNNEANLQLIFDNTETGYALLDLSFNVVLFNKPIHAFFEENMMKALEKGINAVDLFKPEMRQEVTAMIQNAKDGQPSRYEVQCPQPDGTAKWVDVSCRPVKGKDNVVTGVIMSASDVKTR